MANRNNILINFADKLPTTFANRPLLPTNFESRLRSDPELLDSEFDQILPARYRVAAHIHWTPIRVARMVANQIGPGTNQKFVDIGSGVGKLCILLSMLTKLEIYGVEQRRHLHEIAEEIVKSNSIRRINFSHCNMMDIDWTHFDIFFFFNPFQEHILKSENFAIDQCLNFGAGVYKKYVDFVEERIKNLAIGTRVITLEGFGGSLPPKWRLVSSDQIEDGRLDHWLKVF